jgi:hypothetical protein
MITVAVNSEGPALAIRGLYVIGRIFGEINHLHRNARREVVICGSCLRHFKQALKLLLVA